MRLLLDANLSPTLRARLSAPGHDVRHVADHGLLSAGDEEVFEFAVLHRLVIVTADSDFPMMLALRGSTRPSVVLLRHVSSRRPADHSSMLLANLPLVETALHAGAIVSMSPDRVAVRDLPIERHPRDSPRLPQE